ncbi:hypothetical protein [Labrys wisconsinensis]|uniref:Uncharacterized protein n=1 Tax=Labrys wisconsinensis TaxID=425677 RepID=A0ABU0JHW9_9HYPH|nr:hypothetical protein [Labrys wisconsinensis]
MYQQDRRVVHLRSPFLKRTSDIVPNRDSPSAIPLHESYREGGRVKRHGLVLGQSYARAGKFALIKHRRYAHAKQFKRASKALKRLRTMQEAVTTSWWEQPAMPTTPSSPPSDTTSASSSTG